MVASWFHTIPETEVTPAAAAFCALSETLGAEDVETVSPAFALTCPITASELVVARWSTSASVAPFRASVTVRCEIEA